MWTRTIDFAYPYLIPASLVGCAGRKATLSTTPARDVGISLLTTRPGSASLCFKYHKAQTFGSLAPGCEDELSGLDPANKAAFSFNEGHTETKGYSGGIGLCQLTEKHGIKTPTGSDTFPELQSTSYVKEPRRTASRAGNSRNLEDGFVLIMGDSNDI